MNVDGDVQLLILTKESSNQLSTNFPEEYRVITANLLRSMDLDEDGEADCQTCVSTYACTEMFLTITLILSFVLSHSWLTAPPRMIPETRLVWKFGNVS